MKTSIQEIRVIRTKGGHLAAIVNGKFSVVKNEDKVPPYNMYPNITKGSVIEQTAELIAEFTAAFNSIQEEKEKAMEQKRKQEAEAERLRIQNIEESVKGMTPQDFADSFDISVKETARHWSDLHNGRSSFAFIISDDQTLELVQIAESVNGWAGEYGELKHRDGEHHSNFSSVYDIEYYRKNCEQYFCEKYFSRSKETEEDGYFERMQNAESIEEIRDLMKEYDEIEEGYYSAGGSLVYEGFDFSDFWGYSYDVYGYCFGYKLPSKKVFYEGVEEEEPETEE